jgi:hypothetical protein
MKEVLAAQSTSIQQTPSCTASSQSTVVPQPASSSDIAAISPPTAQSSSLPAPDIDASICPPVTPNQSLSEANPVPAAERPIAPALQASKDVTPSSVQTTPERAAMADPPISSGRAAAASAKIRLKRMAAQLRGDCAVETPTPSRTRIDRSKQSACDHTGIVGMHSLCCAQALPPNRRR